MLTEIMFFVYP